MTISFICPQCSRPVDPTAANAMMNAASKQWQHKDCARVTATTLAESE